MEASCPKCGTKRRDEVSSCGKCGLAAARMETFAKERDEAVPEEVANAWDRAVSAWDNVALHDEVLRLVSLHDAYAWAAARYRTRPDELGTRQLERVRKAAEATMMSSAAARNVKAKTPYLATRLMLITLVLLAVGGLVYAMVVRNRGATPTPPTVTPTTN